MGGKGRRRKGRIGGRERVGEGGEEGMPPTFWVKFMPLVS